MAMRPRGGAAGARRGGRTGGVGAVYEDFRPTSEWLQDHESHILNIYLPGFMKEQIKVSTEGRNTIRVRGERLVAGNKWSRFQEDFQVPDNGEMNSVRAKFQGGVLNITVPKPQGDKQPQQTLLTPKPTSTDFPKQPNPIMDQDKVSTSQPTDVKSIQQHNTSADSSTKQGDDSNRKGQDKAFPAAGTSKSADEKNTLSQKASSDNYKSEYDQNGEQRDRKTGIDAKEKNIASEKRDDVTTKSVGTTNKTTIPEKKADNKELYKKEEYIKKAVKGFAELNEERQLLVNMGVAMLVIVFLTAYVTYKYASGRDKN